MSWRTCEHAIVQAAIRYGGGEDWGGAERLGGKGRMSTAITEEWLRECGFKWEQGARQPTKMWVLWLGGACLNSRVTYDSTDLGIMLSQGLSYADDELWNCWIRSDFAGRYSKVIHARYMKETCEVVALIEALIGRTFLRENVWYGSLRTAEVSEQFRRDAERLDQRLGLAWVKRVDAEMGKDSAERGNVP